MSKHRKCMNYNAFQAFLHRKADMDPSKRKEIKGFPPRMCPIRPLRNLWKSLIFNKFHKIFSKPGGVKLLASRRTFGRARKFSNHAPRRAAASDARECLRACSGLAVAGTVPSSCCGCLLFALVERVSPV